MTGRYGLVVMRILRVAGAATVLALGPSSSSWCVTDRNKRGTPASRHFAGPID